MRLVRFSVVGAAGIVVQTSVMAALAHGAGLHYLPAAVAALGCALGHNHAWHVRWTWRDRRPACGHLAAFARFVAANGCVSLLATVALMPVFVGVARLTPVAATLATVAVAGLLNFHLASWLVFTPPRQS